MTKDAGDAVPPKPLIFISYSHKDAAIQKRLDVHLAQVKRELADVWFDGDMLPGADLNAAIRSKLKKADIFVALASPDYLHSTYCYEKEYLFALRKAKRKKLHIIVAVVRTCQWKHTRMGNYLALPKDGKVVEDYGRRSRAYEEIVEGIRAVLKVVKAEQASADEVAKPQKRTPSAGKTRASAVKKPGSVKKSAAARTGATPKPKTKAAASPGSPKAPVVRTRRKKS